MEGKKRSWLGGRKEEKGQTDTLPRAHISFSFCSLPLCIVWNNIPFLPSLPSLSVKRSGPLIVMPITKPQEQPPHQNKVFSAPVFSGPGATRSTVNNKHGPSCPFFFLPDSFAHIIAGTVSHCRQLLVHSEAERAGLSDNSAHFL